MPGEEINQVSAPETSTTVDTAPAQVSESTSAPETPAQTASDTPATSGEKETLLSAVLKSVEPADKKDQSSDGKTPNSQNAETGDQVDAPETETDDASEEPSDDDAEEETLAAEAPKDTKKKFNRLLKQRRELRNEVEALRPAAEIGQQLENYAQANRLSSQDVVMALNLAAMVSNGDMVGFYNTIAPLVRQAQEIVGVVLPPDLEQMVQQQQMTPEAARRFAQTRFEREQMAQHATRVQQDHHGAVVAQTRGNVQQAVAGLEQRFMASDPDYRAKSGLVRRIAQAKLAERGNHIGGVEDALAITQEAYDEANKIVRRTQPPPRPTAPTPNSSSQSTTTARPQPKTLMEAAMQGLERSRAG